MITRRWFIGGACAAAAGFRYGALAGDVFGGRPAISSREVTLDARA
jgi:hypothetical protein